MREGGETGERIRLEPGGVEAELAAALAPVSYTHLRAHETVIDLVCRLLLENTTTQHSSTKPNSYS